MIVAVIDSRSFDGDVAYDRLCAVLGACAIDGVVSGGAKGTDRLAERYALEFALKLQVFLAEWDKFPGKTAAYERNKLIVEAADAATTALSEKHGANQKDVIRRAFYTLLREATD